MTTTGRDHDVDDDLDEAAVLGRRWNSRAESSWRTDSSRRRCRTRSETDVAAPPTPRCTCTSAGREASYDPTLAQAVDEYETRDARRSVTWNDEFA